MLVASACSGGDGESESESASATTGEGSSGGASASTGSSGTASSGSESEGATSSGMTSSATTSSTATTTSATGESETEGEDRGDEAILRGAIAGEIDPAAAIQMVADSGGLPVATKDGTFLFACLCGPGSWRIAGAFNGWTPAAMILGPGGLWWAEETIAAPEGALYKFVDDGDNYVADPRGRRYGYDDFGEYSLVRASAAHLERWYAVSGLGLGPRDVQVLVPADGVFTHAVYAHDGQNLFDPEGIWGGWKLGEAAPPGMLIVGVDNTAARLDEYTHVEDKIGGSLVGGLGDAYAELVHTLIRPRMEAAYGEAGAVAVMGSSLGGLISLAIADRFPDAYDMVISMSATAGWGSIDPEIHNETILEVYAGAGVRPFAIYLDSGGSDGGQACVDLDADGIDDDNDLASDNYCENAQLRQVLLAEGYSEGADLWYVWEPNAPHNEAAWAARVATPLAIFSSL